MGVINYVVLVILTIYALTMVLLLLWGLFTSLKTRSDFYTNKVLWPKGTPNEWGWSNFSVVWQNFVVTATNTAGQKVKIDFWGQVLNSVIYSGGGAFVAVAGLCVSAYLVSKYDYVFSKIVYVVVIVAMVVPVIGTIPSTLLLFKNIGLYDTYTGNFLAKFSFLGGMYFLVFHASFENISKEFYEAAIIDGASEFQVFFKIMVPLVAPTFYTIFLIKFIELWNDYQTALLYLPTHPTLAYGVYHMSITNINGLSSEPVRLASCVIMAIPIMALFIAFKKKIMGNITMGGVKE